MVARHDPSALQADLNAALAREDWPRADALLTTLAGMAPYRTPGMAAIFYNRALVRRRLDRPDAALADLARALEIDPDHANARFEQASLWLERGDWTGAAQGFAAYLERIPRDPDAHLNHAKALSRLGREEDALQAARTADALQSSPATLLAVAETARDTGDLEAMEAALRRLPPRDPAAAAAALKVRTQGAKGRIALLRRTSGAS